MASPLHFLLKACTAVAFVPALQIVLKHKHHFSLYIGIMQIFTSLAYNTADAIGMDVSLKCCRIAAEHRAQTLR